MTSLVVVESPAKAKTISRFLGPAYIVEASFGHVRDLPRNAGEVPEKIKKEKWARLGVNVDRDFEPVYVVPEDKKKQVKKLKDALKRCDELLLATDEDREGESIAWHLLEILKPKVPVRRIVFHEITSEAIKAAAANPRDVDMDLVKAQESRRIIDRLFGYELSPVLWKKVQGGLSAGRVQSVAVRLCVQREREREAFRSAEYWDLEAELAADKRAFKASLARLRPAGEKGEPRRVASGKDFDPATGELKSKSAILLGGDEAKALAKRLADPAGARAWVEKLETKPATQSPSPPFITSTLQQEANRKLNLTARQAMRAAQDLYEGVDLGGGERVGLITYMRTDSTSLADRALKEAEQVIKKLYGDEFYPGRPTRYKTKARGAQEAHEAIRPTELSRLPADVERYLSPAQFKLYRMIWERAVASQMAPAKLSRTLAEVAIEARGGGEKAVFQARGNSILFPGFLRAYVEGSDDPEAELGHKEKLLPQLAEGQELDRKKIDAKGHETKPPARYTEASLIKRLEEEGVGRPSTYASIIGTIQDRGYVFKAAKALAPTFTAYAVTQILEKHFGELVDLGFTSSMEGRLDEVAEGKLDFLSLLADFYRGDSGKPGLREKIKQEDPSIEFPMLPLGRAPEGKEPIVVRIGRYGPYFQRGEAGAGGGASVPDDIAPADLTYEQAASLIDARQEGPRVLGKDPETGLEVTLHEGRFGPYVQLGPTPEDRKAPAPRRASLLPGADMESFGLKEALNLLAFPRVLGENPETGEEITANLGRYGPYIKSGKTSRSLDTDNGDDPATVTMKRALELLAAPPVRRARGAASGEAAAKSRVLGEHPRTGDKITLKPGRFGPYVTDGTYNATVPKGDDADALELSRAVELIDAKAAKGPPPKKKAPAARKAAAKKPAAAKKAPAKKAPAKKKASPSAKA